MLENSASVNHVVPSNENPVLFAEAHSSQRFKFLCWNCMQGEEFYVFHVRKLETLWFFLSPFGVAPTRS